MTVQEIKDLFGEYKIGQASMSDLKLLLAAMGETAGVASLERTKGRPMLVASFYRQVLKDMGKTPQEISDLIPDDVDGSLNVTDLQISLTKLGSDYVA